MKSDFLIIPKDNLIVETYIGVLNLHNISLHKIELIKHPDFSADFDLISDVRDATVDVTLDEVSVYIERMKSMGSFGARRTATIVHTANQQAYAFAFSKLKDQFPQSHNFSSNIDELLQWLDILDKKGFILESLNQLKAKPRFEWKDK